MYKNKSTFFFLFILLFFSRFIYSQSVNAPLNADYYSIINRYEIKKGSFSESFHSTIKSFTRKSIASFATSCLNDSLTTLNEKDRFNLSYLQVDNWEWTENPDSIGNSEKPFLKNLYQKKSDFFHVHDSTFDLHINPVFYFNGGKEQGSTLYINSRGIDIRGMIDNKIGFYTFFTENQAIVPSYVSQQWINHTGVVPNEGFWKGFGSRGVDFFTAKGYVSFNPVRSINLQFGYDKFFLGNGYRSLILSDFSPNYLFLKLNTKIWKINYTNIFAQMQADVFGNVGGTFGGSAFPKKYIASHHLSMNVTKNINIGVFETVVFNRDSTSRGFDITYLNPIIFYRSVEQQLGSPDNAMLGLDFRAIALKHLSFYGQFILDEFLLKEVKAGNGWWSNKFAVQLGGQYIDVFGISNLDFQLECNIIRPYTYAHETKYTNFANYRQPLADPLGANLKELIGIVRYQPLKRLTFTGKWIYAIKGLDYDNLNWGGDILKDYRTHVQEYENTISQGAKTTIQYIDFTLIYMLKHNLFVDLKLARRLQRSDLEEYTMSSSFVSVGIRCNIPQRLYDF